jgi:uncharacterized lipoprotein YmbA
MTVKIESEEPRVKRSEIEMPVAQGTVTVIKEGASVSARFDIQKLSGTNYKEQLTALIKAFETAAQELETELRYL